MADAELPEDAREVPFDRAVGEEERGGDLAVRLALGDERRDALLGRRERARRRRASADPLELAARALGPERGADPLEDRERLLERRARLAPPLQRAAARRRARAACGRDRAGARPRMPARAPPRTQRARRRGRRPARRGALGSARSWRAPRRARAGGRCPRTSRAARSPRRCARARSAPRSRSTTKRVAPGSTMAFSPHERDASGSSCATASSGAPSDELEVTERRRRDERGRSCPGAISRARVRGVASPRPPGRAAPARAPRARGCSRRRAAVRTARPPLALPGTSSAASRSPESALDLAQEAETATVARSRRRAPARVAWRSTRARRAPLVRRRPTSSSRRATTSGWSRTRRSAAELWSAERPLGRRLSVGSAQQRLGRERAS